MKIVVGLVVENKDDIDKNDDTGLTVEAYGRLIQAVASAGFDWEYVVKERRD